MSPPSCSGRVGVGVGGARVGGGGGPQGLLCSRRRARWWCSPYSYDVGSTQQGPRVGNGVGWARGRVAAGVESLLASVYDAPPPSKLQRRNDLSADDKARMRETSGQGDKAWIYGELTYDGACALRDSLRPTRDDAFVDLGSGYGRLVFTAHLDWSVGSSVGVELSSSRHEAGTRALHALGSLGALDASREVRLVQGDMLALDVSKATLVYVALTMFDDAFTQRILDKLSSEAPHLRYVITTEDVERRFGSRLPDGWTLAQSLVVSQSWADDCTLSIYQVRRQSEPEPEPKWMSYVF
ncbi:DOT1 domain-containing protein [Pycnococcus provasolii]